MNRCIFNLAVALTLILSGALGRAQNSVLTSYPAGPNALYSGGVKIAVGAPIYFSSGGGAGKDGGATMKAQALTAMAKLKDNISHAGFKLSDVVFVRAYLAPGADGTIDYAGWNAAWSEVFGNASMPNKPARTTVGLPKLGGPTALIEIEYVCAAPPSPEIFESAAKQGLPVSNPHLKPYGTKEARIYTGTGVTGGTALYWTAGSTAGKDGGTDTKTQAVTALTKLKENLAAAGLTFKDVVFLRALVGPDKNKGGKHDLDGWNEAYGQFFNSADNPHKPSRTSIPIETFGGTTLIEIEIIAAFPAPPPQFASEDTSAVSLKDYGDAKAVISSGVAVPENRSFYFSAGVLPSVDGDMKAQAGSALKTLQARLAEAGLSFKDVTFLRAYVVPEADGNVDRKGWGDVYGEYFNNPSNPHKPARTTVAIKSLPKAGAKIEIDVIAVSSK